MNLQKVLDKQKKVVEGEHRDQLKRLVPVAEFALTLLSANPPMGDITNTQPKEYEALALKLQQRFLDENIGWVERYEVFKLVQQAVDFLKVTTLDHLEKSFNFASNKLWGGKDLMDVKMQDIDNVLKG